MRRKSNKGAARLISWRQIASLRVKGNRRILFTPFLVAIFLAISAVCFYICRERIRDEYYHLIGRAAQDMATLVAGEVDLTDAEIAALKSMTFAEAAQTPINERLQKTADRMSGGLPVKYICMFDRIPDNEVTRFADDAKAEELGVETGTPLDMIWLLDAHAEEDELAAGLLESDSYYIDINRYSILRDWQARLISDPATTYVRAIDEWGDVVTGCAPIYTREGNFAGVMCVDIDAGEITKHSRATLLMIAAIYLATVLMLCALFAILYQKYFKVRQQQLYIDPLTNAYNRRYLNELFKKSFNYKKHSRDYLALVMLDIDDFKMVNDSYGHESGDICLKQIANAIAEVLKRPPNVLIRYGGEEFLAAITVSDCNQAKLEIGEILEGVRRLRLFGDERKVTVSGGAALLPYAEIAKTDITFVIKEADDNCYYCKRNGKDQFKITDYTRKRNGANK